MGLASFSFCVCSPRRKKFGLPCEKRLPQSPRCYWNDHFRPDLILFLALIIHSCCANASACIFKGAIKELKGAENILFYSAQEKPNTAFSWNLSFKQPQYRLFEMTPYVGASHIYLAEVKLGGTAKKRTQRFFLMFALRRPAWTVAFPEMIIKEPTIHCIHFR